MWYNNGPADLCESDLLEALSWLPPAKTDTVLKGKKKCACAIFLARISVLFMKLKNKIRIRTCKN